MVASNRNKLDLVSQQQKPEGAFILRCFTKLKVRNVARTQKGIRCMTWEFCLCASMCVQTCVRIYARVCVCVYVCVLPHVCVHASVSFPRSNASWWQIASCPFQALLYKHFNHIKILTELSLGLSPKFLRDTILSVGFSQILTSDTISIDTGEDHVVQTCCQDPTLWM